MGKIIDLPAVTANISTTSPIEVINPSILVGAAEVIEIAIPTKNVQQTKILPVGTKRFLLIAGNGILKLDFITGVLTNNIELSPRDFIEEKNIDPTATITLFFASSKDADEIKLLLWS